MIMLLYYSPVWCFLFRVKQNLIYPHSFLSAAFWTSIDKVPLKPVFLADGGCSEAIHLWSNLHDRHKFTPLTADTTQSGHTAALNTAGEPRGSNSSTAESLVQPNASIFYTPLGHDIEHLLGSLIGEADARKNAIGFIQPTSGVEGTSECLASSGRVTVEAWATHVKTLDQMKFLWMAEREREREKVIITRWLGMHVYTELLICNDCLEVWPQMRLALAYIYSDLPSFWIVDSVQLSRHSCSLQNWGLFDGLSSPELQGLPSCKQREQKRQQGIR